MSNATIVDANLNSSQASTGRKSHPKGFWLICFTILWERFSYYGLTALLILYFTASVAQGGMGMDTATASSAFGLFTGLIYFTPLVGGYIADKWLGQQKCITIGCFLIAFGNVGLFMSGTKLMVYAGLILLILGNGFFKANCANMVGDLYPKQDAARKDAAYSLFYMAINVGAFIAPMLTGLISDNICAVKSGGQIVSYGYKAAFLTCGIGMFIGAFVFMALSPKLLGNIGKYPATKNVDGKVADDKPLTAQEKRRCVALIIITIFVTFFWAAFYQSNTSFAIYSRDFVDRNIGGFEMPVPWFTSLNSILCVALAPIMGGIWIRLSKTKRGDLGIISKMALGIIFMGVGFVFMMISIFSTHGTQNPAIKASIIWICTTYLFNTIGELCLSPIGLSMFNKLSPPKYAAFFMGVWHLSSCFANILAGKLSGFTEHLGFLSIFQGIAITMFVLGGVMLLFRKKLEVMME